ncbi:6785_t:CDS:2, partial [Racocetra fulgida]
VVAVFSKKKGRARSPLPSSSSSLEATNQVVEIVVGQLVEAQVKALAGLVAIAAVQ